MPISLDAILERLQSREIILALGIIGILILLFIPIPAIMLDMMFVMNITAAIMILLTVLFINKALEFSAFPMLLLITTMFRLALNIASTRLILTNGAQSSEAAGQIIETFGQVIVGGSFVVGLTIFMVLVIVNFMVITRGAGRIAEVAARFTLDSLPGKQMAIDADLNAGLITEDQARDRRSELEQETGFYGAMDGASKFVKGDAIAGLIITALNIVVGMLIGIMQYNMDAGEAASRFMLLTIGDGLVAQIPALIISTAAGMLVAKSGTVQAAGEVVLRQIASNPLAMYVTAGLMVVLSFIPNMPLLPFWVLAAGLIALGYTTQQNTLKEEKQREMQEAQARAAEAEEQAETEEPMASILHVDSLRLELGYGLLGLIDEARGGRLTDQIKAMRRQLAREMGFVTPSVRIQDNMQADQGAYTIYIKDVAAGEGQLRPGMLMAMDPTGGAPTIAGEDTTEPSFGLPAKWIEESKKEEAQFNGYTVVDNATVIVTHLTEVIKDNLPELLSRQEIHKLVDEMRNEHSKLVEDLIPDQVNYSVLQQVLRNLLSERISVRDLPTILEALADGVAAGSGTILNLTEQVRQRLSRQLCMQHMGADGVIPLLALTGTWEQEFAKSVRGEGDNRQLAMDPAKVQQFIKGTSDAVERQLITGTTPVLLTSPSIRPFVRSITERSMPQIAVLSQAEIHPKAKIKTVGTV
jgi:flagellar biosynthesis protein FlhA